MGNIFNKSEDYMLPNLEIIGLNKIPLTVLLQFWLSSETLSANYFRNWTACSSITYTDSTMTISIHFARSSLVETNMYLISLCNRHFKRFFIDWFCLKT